MDGFSNPQRIERTLQKLRKFDERDAEISGDRELVGFWGELPANFSEYWAKYLKSRIEASDFLEEKVRCKICLEIDAALGSSEIVIEKHGRIARYCMYLPGFDAIFAIKKDGSVEFEKIVEEKKVLFWKMKNVVYDSRM